MSFSMKLTILGSCTVIALAIVFAVGALTGFMWQMFLTNLVLLSFVYSIADRIHRASKAEAAPDERPINVVFMEREGFPQ